MPEHWTVAITLAEEPESIPLYHSSYYQNNIGNCLFSLIIYSECKTQALLTQSSPITMPSYSEFEEKIMQHKVLIH